MKLYKFYLSCVHRGFFYTTRLLIDLYLNKFFLNSFSIKSYIKIKGILRLGYIINFKKPMSFNEKILMKKIYTDIHHLAKYADKYTVRKIIKNKISNDFLIKLIQVVEDAEQIDFTLL